MLMTCTPFERFAAAEDFKLRGSCPKLASPRVFEVSAKFGRGRSIIALFAFLLDVSPGPLGVAHRMHVTANLGSST